MEKPRVIAGMGRSRRGGLALAAALAAATLAAGATASAGGQVMRVISVDEASSLSGSKSTGSKSDQSRKDGARVANGYRRQTNAPRRKGPGWTNAHAKRVAAKVRAVKKHRASSKCKR